MNLSLRLFTIIYQKIFKRKVIYLICLPIITAKVYVRFIYHAASY